jgi:hypothetical protein
MGFRAYLWCEHWIFESFVPLLPGFLGVTAYKCECRSLNLPGYVRRRYFSVGKLLNMESLWHLWPYELWPSYQNFKAIVGQLQVSPSIRK